MYAENGGVSAAADQMAGMQKLGFLELFRSLPCVPFRAMPRGVVPKKGTDELRGIGDQGQPRKRLLTQRSGEPVTSLNELSRGGKWSHQNMDSLESAAHNSAVLQAWGDLNGKATINMAFDFSSSSTSSFTTPFCSGKWAPSSRADRPQATRSTSPSSTS